MEITTSPPLRYGSTRCSPMFLSMNASPITSDRQTNPTQTLPVFDWTASFGKLPPASSATRECGSCVREAALAGGAPVHRGNRRRDGGRSAELLPSVSVCSYAAPIPAARRAPSFLFPTVAIRFQVLLFRRIDQKARLALTPATSESTAA